MKNRYIIKREPLDIRASFNWNYTYNNVHKTFDQAKEFLTMLAKESFIDHNIEEHEDYFIDNTTQTKTYIQII